VVAHQSNKKSLNGGPFKGGSGSKQLDLILNNPFRVLGLPATASSRDIAKRISDLETYAELGKTKTYPSDFLSLGPLIRTSDAIKEAAQKIEQAEGKLFHSFFWFRSSDSVDELAMESLSAGNAEEALSIWEKQLGKKGSKKYTWRLNSAVLRLKRSHGLDELDDSEYEFDKDEFDSALEELGFVIDDELDSSISDVLNGAEAGFDRETLWKKIVDELLRVIKALPNSPYGNNALQIVDSCWSFPEEARDYVSSRVVNPLVDEVQKAVEKSRLMRTENCSLAALRNTSTMKKVERIISELHDSLGEDSQRFQSIANEYANELCSLGVEALNEYKEVDLAHSYMEWASRMPSFSQIRIRIQENKENVDDWVRSAKNKELLSGITEKLGVDIHTLTQAENLYTLMKSELSKVVNKLGRDDETYIAISTACVHRLLGFVIDVVNKAQDEVSTNRNWDGLKATIRQATELTRKLRSFDMDAEAAERLRKNLAVIEGLSEKMSQPIPRPQTNSGGNVLENIPGWLWVVGVIFLLSMCSK
jgi:hypothetical protein